MIPWGVGGGGVFFKVKQQSWGGIQTFLFFILAAEEGDRQGQKGKGTKKKDRKEKGKRVGDHRNEWNYYQLSPPAAALHRAEFIISKRSHKDVVLPLEHFI